MTAPPPSKSDRRISRIWLSSQWVLLREGAALRLVPKHPAQSFGANKVNCARLSPLVASPCGHSLRLCLRRSVRTESSSRRRPSWATCVTDWSFSFHCSPPRIAATQLRFDTGVKPLPGESN